MAISKKVRFEVFKRDKFTCQYCGRAAPDVLLHADHIEPKSKGGKNTILNLITSCESCNLGKGATPLSDASAIAKQRNQLEALEERQQQLKMMLEWQTSLSSLDDTATNGLETMWSEMTGYSLTADARRGLRKILRDFWIPEVAEAMRIARDTYLVMQKDGIPTHESVNNAYRKLGGICQNRRRQRDNPHHFDTLYILGVLRNRFPDWTFYTARQLLTTAFQMGMSRGVLYQIAVEANKPREWEGDMQDIISGEGDA